MKNPNYKILPNGHEISAAILMIDKDNGVLACHPTMQPKRTMYDLPKGHVEVGEEDIDAAIREFGEETGLNEYGQLNIKDKLIDKGILPYVKKKDLHLFVYKFDGYIEDLFPIMKCKSYFTNKNGKHLPEMNGYAVFYEGQFHFFMPAICNIVTKYFNNEL